MFKRPVILLSVIDCDWVDATRVARITNYPRHRGSSIWPKGAPD
jgi:hypothetical protein